MSCAQVVLLVLTQDKELAPSGIHRYYAQHGSYSAPTPQQCVVEYQVKHTDEN